MADPFTFEEAVADDTPKPFSFDEGHNSNEEDKSGEVSYESPPDKKSESLPALDPLSNPWASRAINTISSAAATVGKELNPFRQRSLAELLTGGVVAIPKFLSKPLFEAVPKLSNETVKRLTTPPVVPNAPELRQDTPEFTTGPRPGMPDNTPAPSAPSEKAVAVATGIENAGADFINFFTSPIGIATLGMGSLPAAAQKAIALGFSAQMAKDVPEIATQLGEELGKPEEDRDYKKISSLTANAIANTTFASLGAVHGLKETPSLGGDLNEALQKEPIKPVTEPVTQTKEKSALSKSKTDELHADVLREPESISDQVSSKEGEQGVPSPEKEKEVSGLLTPDQVDKMSTADLQKRLGRRAHAVGIEYGLTLSEKDVPELQAKYDSTMDAIKKGASSSDMPAIENALARQTYYGGALQGATRGKNAAASSNYELYLKEQAANKPSSPQTGIEPLSDRPVPVSPLETLSDRPVPVPSPDRPSPESPSQLENLSDRTVPPPSPLETLSDRPAPPEPPTPSKSETPRGGSGKDVTGIAQRVREKVAAAGQERLSPTGEGISAPDSTERGEQLLKSDPEAADKAMFQFENDPNKAVSADGMALAKARLRQLAQVARNLEAKGGPEYEAAFKARSDWNDRIKKMQTEWNKTGMAQQGEQDIDTGTFTGLREAYTDATGKDFTPEQKGTAKKVAARVNGAQQQVEIAKTKFRTILKDTGGMAYSEKRAFDAANKVVRENAIREAKLENAKRVSDAATKTEIAKMHRARDAKTQAIIDKVVRENAIREAKLENAKRVSDAATKTEIAKMHRARDAKTQAIIDKVVRENAIRERKAEIDARVNPEKLVWEKVGQYLEQGMDDFDDIRSKAATDLGMTVKKVTDLLTRNKRAKFLADDLWRKQEALRRFKSQANRWLKSTALPTYQKALSAVPRILFAVKVGFHGTVAMGTHAPMLFFEPMEWGNYFRNYAKMYRNVGGPTPAGQARARAYYEMQVQELLRDPNYPRMLRAGLQVNPSTYEEYAIPEVITKAKEGAALIAPEVAEYFNSMVGMGNRGYATLKMLRRDMFNQHWNKLPKTTQIDEMASAISDAVNHSTGVTKKGAPQSANLALFAPRLEASRVMWLAGDPMRAAKTFLDWNNADDGEKWFAVNQIKEKAWVAGTLGGLLALNQGILSATGSDQKVNITDPFKSDWLKFKAGGKSISYGNAMVTMARLPVRLYKIRSSDGGKLKNLIYPDESSYSLAGEYARSQMSPFASLATTLWLKSDWQNRPLPNSTRPVPKRLRAQGVYPYTWPEFLTEQVLPIPAEEAVRDVWKNGLGMNDKQMSETDKMLASISVVSEILAMMGTGARINDDVQYKQYNKK